MTKVTFELPSSSLPELEKIIDGYFVLDTNVSLDDISNLTGINRTALSPNHPFLKEIGIIQGTNQKSVTLLGKDLGGAIHHKLPDEIQQYWLQIVDSNEFLSKIAASVRIKKGISTSELISHILFVTKAPDNKNNRTGANAVVDIFLKSKRLVDVDGKLMYSDSTPKAVINTSEEKESEETVNDQISKDEKVQYPKDKINSGQTGFPNLHINIQIHISADSSPDQIDQIFASMAKHLKDFGKLNND